MRLGITGQLATTLCSTNPCESMIEIVRYTQRNVKRWQDGDMRKRWTAAGMLVAEQQFRRIIGYRDLAKLVIADRAPRPPRRPERTATARRSPSPLPSDRQPRDRRRSSTTIRTTSADPGDGDQQRDVAVIGALRFALALDCVDLLVEVVDQRHARASTFAATDRGLQPLEQLAARVPNRSETGHG